jgi:predicted TIM-barrel fold metal-dependent hydrolase
VKICQYIYCKNRFSNDRSFCPICGCPVDTAKLKDFDFICSLIPQLPMIDIIDMHQIIPNEENMFDFQLKMMEQLKISKILVQSVPTQVKSIWSNRKLLGLQQSHSGLFIVSHFMDPRHPFACRRLRQYKRRGINVIKLLPCLGYYPDESRWGKFWKTMEELKLIAMIHTGFITARHKKEEQQAGIYLHSKFGQPIFFDILARKYPKLQFILCHMGGDMWVEQAVQMVNQHENAWGDISGSGILALKKIVQCQITVDWTRLFWGNDSSPYNYPFNLKLLLHYIEIGKLHDTLPLLLRENAIKFIEKFLI